MTYSKPQKLCPANIKLEVTGKTAKVPLDEMRQDKKTHSLLPFILL
jgi:hypothetical protein